MLKVGDPITVISNGAMYRARVKRTGKVRIDFDVEAQDAPTDKPGVTTVATKGSVKGWGADAEAELRAGYALWMPAS